MLVNLYKSHKVGDLVNFAKGVYLIKRETGLSHDCLSGGKGVRQVELEYVQEGPLTIKELQYLKDQLNQNA